MHAVEQYDSSTYSVIFNGYSFSGYGKGSFITIEYDSNGFEDQIGCDGQVVRLKTCDQRATVGMTLMIMSPDNKVASAMYNADMKSPNGIGVGPILIRNDKQGFTVFMGAHAWIQKMPKIEISDEPGEIEWIFRVAKLEAVVG